MRSCTGQWMELCAEAGCLIYKRQMSPPAAYYPLHGGCWEDEGDDAFKTAPRSLNKRHAREMDC